MARGYHRRRKRFPEIGRIRKGAPKEKNKPGKDLTYFRIDLDTEDPGYDEAQRLLFQHYQEEPRALDVFLPFPTVDDNYEAYYEAYLQSGLVFRGEYWPDEHGHRKVLYIDKRRVGLSIDLDVGLMFNPAEPIGSYKTQKGKPKPLIAVSVGRLRVILPVLKRLASLTVLTGSKHDISQLDEQLAALEDFGSQLTAIPLLLTRKPKKIKTPSGEDGEPVRREKWLIHIEAHPTWVGQKLIEAQRATLLLPQAEIEIVDVVPRLIESAEGIAETAMPKEKPKPAAKPKTQTTKKKKETKNVNGDPQSQYWAAVYSFGLDKETGAAILKECGSDFGRALEAVNEQWADVPF